MRSDWRGEARNTSEPKRAKSKRLALADIISIAQQARPNMAGHNEDRYVCGKHRLRPLSAGTQLARRLLSVNRHLTTRSIPGSLPCLQRRPYPCSLLPAPRVCTMMVGPLTY